MKKLGFWLRTVFSAIFFALLLIPVLGPPLYVEVSNRVAPGVVVAKREEIKVRRSFWSRRLILDVRYVPTDTEAPELAPIVVDAQRYDHARLGAQVQVRYLPLPDLRQLGAIAAPRLEDQPPLGPLRAQLSPARELLIGLAIWLVLRMLISAFPTLPIRIATMTSPLWRSRWSTLAPATLPTATKLPTRLSGQLAPKSAGARWRSAAIWSRM